MKFRDWSSKLDEAHKAAQTYDSGGKAMVLLIAYLTEHQLYDEAIETNLEVKDTFTRYSNKLADKLSDSIVEMAKRQNKRRDYRFVAEHVATFMKASPIAMKKGQELISRIMDAVPGRPALYDELMKILTI